MDNRERLFIDEYIINKGNAYQAALQAGYKHNTAKLAYQWLENETKTNQTRRLPYKPYLKKAIEERFKKIEDAKKADGDEVIKYLTSVMRKESISKTVIVINDKKDGQKVVLVDKPPDERDSIKAADILSKIMGLSNHLEINLVNKEEAISSIDNLANQMRPVDEDDVNE